MAPFAQKRIEAHRMPGYTTGRPTEYRFEYCQLVIEQMAKGISLAAFAGVIGVARETVYAWRERHPEFSDAVSRAQAAQQLAWELKLIHSRKGAETAASIFALKNIAPDEWKDVKYQQHDHNVKLESMTDAQLYAIAGKAKATDSVVDGEFTRVEPQQTDER